MPQFLIHRNSAHNKVIILNNVYANLDIPGIAHRWNAKIPVLQIIIIESTIRLALRGVKKYVKYLPILLWLALIRPTQNNVYAISISNGMPLPQNAKEIVQKVLKIPTRLD